MRVGVVVATLGRPEECRDLIKRLLLQDQPASAIIISVEKQADLPAELPDGVEVIMGPRGLCAQRNRGVTAIADRSDVIVFFDDDYLPAISSLSGLSALFGDHPDVVGATGDVLADGVLKGGIPLDEALAIVEAFDGKPARPAVIEKDIRTAYGCNMAFRVEAMRQIAFDERLPLYGWQEDVDFACQILRFGRVVKTNAFTGVHRGVSNGRTPGLRLGFSQIVNPIYLVKKGTMGWSHAATLMAGNVLANHLKVVRPEPHIDRLGRAKGNWLGLAHIVSGKLDPLKILEIK